MRQKPSLEPALEIEGRPFPDREAADLEIVAHGGVAQHHRPVPGRRRQLREEQAWVALRPAQRRHRFGLREGEGLVADEALELLPRGPGETLPRAIGWRGKRRLGGAVGEPQHRGEVERAVGRDIEREALHVHEPGRQGHLSEEPVDVGEAAYGGDVHGHVPAGPGLGGRTGPGLDRRQAGPLGQAAHQRHVGGGLRAVGQDAAQGLEAPVQEQSLVGERARRGHGQQQGHGQGHHEAESYPRAAGTAGGVLTPAAGGA